MGAHPTHEKAAKRALTAHAPRAAQSEAQRRAGMIAAILDPGAINNAMALDFSTLADATLSQCVVRLRSSRIEGEPQDPRRHESAFDARARRNGRRRDESRRLEAIPRRRPCAASYRPARDRAATASARSIGSTNGSPASKRRLPIRSRTSPCRARQRHERASSPPGKSRRFGRPPLPFRNPAAIICACSCSCRYGGRNSPTRAAGHSRQRRSAGTRRRFASIKEPPLHIGSRWSLKRVRSLNGYSPPPAQPTTSCIKLSEDGSSMNSWRRFQEAIERASGVAFGFHDPRRLFATESGEHDLADFSLIDAALNHAAAVSKTGASKRLSPCGHANATRQPHVRLGVADSPCRRQRTLAARRAASRQRRRLQLRERQMTDDLATLLTTSRSVRDEFVTHARTSGASTRKP